MSRRVEERDEIPGPGSYNPNKSMVLKRPQSAQMGTGKRFYRLNTESCGSFYDSKMSGGPKYTFTKKKKLNDKFKEGPGPGAYQIDSSMCNLSSYVFKK